MRQADRRAAVTMLEDRSQDRDTRNRGRIDGAINQIECTPGQATSAGLFAWMAAVDDRDLDASPGEPVGRPGARWSGADDSNFRITHRPQDLRV
jgi:hypothetical protein